MERINTLGSQKGNNVYLHLNGTTVPRYRTVRLPYVNTRQLFINNRTYQALFVFVFNFDNMNKAILNIL
jgi:hypothetical protein